ncbi:MAG: hypothetical protein HYU02_07815 [Thaumarchaeota archaeon]|nr:hypothetical protein [Nitrososphaerota archaeon]
MFRKIIENRISIQGKVDVYLWDAKKVPTFDESLKYMAMLGSKDGRKFLAREGILIKEGHGWNLIVDVGKQKVIDYIVNLAPSGFTHCGIGTDSTAPAAGNTTLGAQVDRRAIDDKRRSGTDARLTTFFPSTSPAVGSTIREMGIFDAVSGGNLYARAVSPTSFAAFTFLTGSSLTMDYTSGW